MYIKGPAINHWVIQQVNWLNNSLITMPPHLMLLEEFVFRFKWDWANVNVPAKARAKLDKLCMKGDELDQYITDFTNHTIEARFHLTDPACLEYFKKGLPPALLEKCLQLDRPMTWAEWCDSARDRQAIWMELKNYQVNISNPVKKRPFFT